MFTSAPSAIDLDVWLQPKQSELWGLWDDSETSRLGMGGARGGAKSGGGRRCMLLRRFKYPRTTGLILRRTLKELEQSHILKLFEEYPHLRTYYREQKKQLILPNGSVLFFGSAQSEKDMGNFYSAEFADIMVDEAQEFSQRELEQLSGSNRCTSNSDIMPKMVFTFMPGLSESGLPPKGLPYLKRMFVDGEPRGEEAKHKWAFIQAFSWDNSQWAKKELERDGISEETFYSWSADDRRDYFLTRTEYGATLQAITDAHLRDAWLYGKWDVFQGQYFPNFDSAKHIISRQEAWDRIKPWHKRWISGDWGFDHPHCFHWHAIDERGSVITYREQWGREMGETELGKLIGRLNGGEKPVAFPFSWDAGKLSSRSSPKYPKSIIQMLSEALPDGLTRPHPADSSPGSRVAGWRLMSQLLDAGMWQIVEEDCPKLIECIPTLVRNPDNTEDVLKVDYSENYIGDDAADSARMGLQYMLGSSRRPQAEVIREQAQQIEDPVARHYFILKEHAKMQESGGVVKQPSAPGWQHRLK